MPEWLFPVLSIVGAIGGSYVGVRVALAELKVRVKNIEDRQTEHRERIVYLEHKNDKG